jgi:hypothetical protein
MIIDCHTHLSRLNHQGQAFVTIRDNLLNSMARQGIDHALVYPDSEFGTCVADLETTRGVIEGYPKLHMLGTIALPNLDPGILSRLDHLASAGKIVGIKLYPGFELFYPDQSACYPVYELSLKHDLAVVFHSGETMHEAWRDEYSHPQRIAQVADTFPRLRIVIAHFSQPHLMDCRDVVMSKANVYADISGLGHPEVEECCDKAAIRTVLEEVAMDQPTKILFGTDWPICEVSEHIALVESLTVPEATKARILSENAEAVFRLASRS